MSEGTGIRSRTPIERVIAWALRRSPVRAFLLYGERRGPMLADSVTYRALFSVFAAVLLGFSLAGLWLAGNPAALGALVDAVDAVVPGLMGPGGLVDPARIRIPVGLTLTGILSLAGLVGAAIGAIGSLRTALRVIAGRVHDDAFWLWTLVRNLLLAVAIGAALVVSAAATFFGTAFIGALKDWIGIGPEYLADAATRALSILVVLALDTGIVALLFVALSGVRAPARALWTGALLGGVGLTVLQQLSGLFVGGAASNPLLASFASLIALLLWFNLSSQVILLAGAYIVVGAGEAADRVRARHGAETFAQRRVLQAEDAVRAAADELAAARAQADREREARLAKASAPRGEAAADPQPPRR